MVSAGSVVAARACRDTLSEKSCLLKVCVLPVFHLQGLEFQSKEPPENSRKRMEITVDETPSAGRCHVSC